MILGESRLPMRFTGHVGADIPLGNRGKYYSTTSIMPNIIYQYQNGFQELNIGTYVKYGNFTVGAWYRNRDAFILCFGITTDKFKLGYSYDITVSKLETVFLEDGMKYPWDSISSVENLKTLERYLVLRFDAVKYWKYVISFSK